MSDTGAVALTEAGLAAALKLEAEGVDVSAFVSERLGREAKAGAGLASFARSRGLRVWCGETAEYTEMTSIVTNGRGAPWDSGAHDPYVRLRFVRGPRHDAPVLCSAQVMSNGDEYAPINTPIPDTATTPAEWVEFAESLVADLTGAARLSAAEKRADYARGKRNAAWLGNARWL